GSGYEAERLELMPCVNRGRWARGKISQNTARGGVEGPEADLEQLKGVEKLKSSSAEMRRKNNDGNMSVKAIAVGLGECFPPVAQLELKRADNRLGLADESVRSHGSELGPVGRRFPTNGNEVRDSIPVDR